MNFYTHLKIPTVVFRIILALTLITVSLLAFAPTKHLAIITASDKINHFLAFFVLSCLLDSSWPQTYFDAKKISCLFLYALFVELVQSQLPYRAFSLLDILADIAGIFTYGLGIFLITHCWLKNKKIDE